MHELATFKLKVSIDCLGPMILNFHCTFIIRSPANYSYIICLLTIIVHAKTERISFNLTLTIRFFIHLRGRGQILKQI